MKIQILAIGAMLIAAMTLPQIACAAGGATPKAAFANFKWAMKKRSQNGI